MKSFKLFRKGTRFIKIFLGLSVLSLLIIFVLFSTQKNSLETDIREQKTNDVAAFSNVFLEELSQLSTDIFLITDLLNVHDSLIINGTSTEFTNQGSRDIIETEFLVWLGMKQTYDQIRVIDNTGQEIVRANYNSGAPYIVEVSELQLKADRYYFSESIILNDRDLYMSVLDLNVENNQIELVNGETKPMLRVATPLFNTDGVKLGIVIVNYLAEDLFKTLEASESGTDTNIEIINENGYYLYAIDESIEFGFMYDDLVDEIFTKHHEYEIFSIPNGIVTNEKYDGEFYSSIRLSGLELTNAANNSNNEDINIVLGTKEFIIFTELDLDENPTYRNMMVTYIVISIVSILLSLVITRLLDESVHLREENFKRMKYDSTHDLLTTLPNRKSVYEQIQYLLNRKKEFTLLFIDFDGFKNINDQFGHDKGDEALIQGSQRINDSIRFDDVLARIGGDEFIVVLKDLSNQEIVSRICSTIVSSFSDTFDLSGSIAKMGISIGAYINYDCSCDLEDIISKSDKAMYQVKNSGKNNFLIFQNDEEK